MVRNKKTYLIGAIESVTNHGADWRKKLTADLKGINLEITDPCEEETSKTGYEVAESKRKAYGWKRGGNWADFDTMFDKIIEVDLKHVKESDFLLLYFNVAEHTLGGTISELTIAHELKIPVFCKLDGAKSDMNSWVLRLITKHGQIFKTWEELIERVKKECK